MNQPPNTIATLLRKNAYKIRSGQGSFEIIRKYDAAGVAFISILIGVVLVVFGVFGDPKIGLLGITMVIGPILHEKYKYPKRIIFDGTRKTLTTYKNSLISNSYPFHSIEDLQLERIIHKTTASPFRTHTNKYIYRFFIEDKREKRHKLIKLDSLDEIDEQMQEMAEFINRLIDK